MYFTLEIFDDIYMTIDEDSVNCSSNIPSIKKLINLKGRGVCHRGDAL